MPFKIPSEIISIGKTLNEAGFEAYLVGGCVRDLLLDKEPKDWDITTNAEPKEIQEFFPDSVYENNFGTVAVKTDSEDPKLKIVEITTYRQEVGYSDSRHPDQVKFTSSLGEDLARRDFTINAIALSIPKSSRSEGKLKDPFSGRQDLKDKLIRAVGNPSDRFAEDALRLMRAVRLATELNFKLEPKTAAAVLANKNTLSHIAPERIRDELIKIINADKADEGIRLLEKTGLLKYVLPELEEGIGVTQNHHHIYTVFDHNVRALAYTAQKNYSFEVRLASLLHDVGKPRTKRGHGENSTFYTHEIVGAKMVRQALKRLRFPTKIVDKVTHLVRHHLFYYNVGEVSEAGVRRFIARVGLEHIDDLLRGREADRIGSGTPKAFPYKLRHLQYMIDKVRRDPISPKMLKISGDELMPLLNLKPSPRVGMLLNALLNGVIENPKRNTEKYLTNRAKELNKLSDEELAQLMADSKKKQDQFEKAVDSDIKKRYYIK